MHNVFSRVNRGNGKMQRRDFHKGLAAAMSLVTIRKNSTGVCSEQTTSWIDDTLDCLETLRRPDGGYGWPDQLQSHLTPSYAVTGCYNLLRRIPPGIRLA